MTKELVLDVVARKHSRDLQTLAAEFDKLAAEAEASGRKINKSFSGSIDEQIKGTRKELQSLKAEFAKTGDLKIAGDIGGLERNLKSLQKIRATLTTDLESAGKDAGIGMMQAVAYGAAAVAPIVLPAVGGAILAGLGLGVIGAGIVGQLHSSQVQAALAQFKTDAGSTFKDATTPFGPVLAKGLSDADDVLRKISPELTAMFKEAAPAADALFKGIEGLVEKAIPGLHKGLDGAVVVIDELGRDLPAVGKAIGDAFAGAAAGARGDADALHDLLTVADQLIVTSGRLAGESGKLYEQLRSVAALDFKSPSLSLHSLQDTFTAVSTGGIAPALKSILGIGDSSKDAAYQVDNLGTSLTDLGPAAKTSADALRYLDGELDSLIGKQLTLDQANDKFKEDLLGLKDQLDVNSRSIDQNSLAGLHNRDVLLGMIGDAERARQAAIDHAGGVNASKAAVDAANTAYQQAIDQLVGVASQAGISRDALNKLAGNYQINVLLAIDAVLKSGLAQNVAPHDPGRYGSAGPPKRASGGSVLAGMPYIVGEQRPEVFVPDVNGTIIPKIPAAPSFRSLPGTRGGAGRVAVTVASSGGDVAAALAPVVAQMIRTGAIRLHVRADGTVSAGV